MLRFALLIGLISLLKFAAPATTPQGARPNPAQKSAATTVPATPRAKWGTYWEELLGINEQDFQNAGLQNLTPEQASSLFLIISNGHPNLTCERFYNQTEQDELRYVHLYVTGSAEDSEFVGRLRGKLSAIRDVKIVPSEDDADLVVNSLSFSNFIAGRQTGFTASLVVTYPCVYKVPAGLGQRTEKLERVLDHYLRTSADEDNLATQVSNQLDARDFDDTRSSHSALLKYYQGIKK